MVYNINYYPGEDPKRITLEIPSINDVVVPYLTENGRQFSIVGLDGYTLLITLAGTSQLQFDNGTCTVYINENATPESFTALTADLFGYEQEDFDTLYNKILSVFEGIPNAMGN